MQAVVLLRSEPSTQKLGRTWLRRFQELFSYQSDCVTDVSNATHSESPSSCNLVRVTLCRLSSLGLPTSSCHHTQKPGDQHAEVFSGASRYTAHMIKIICSLEDKKPIEGPTVVASCLVGCGYNFKVTGDVILKECQNLEPTSSFPQYPSWRHERDISNPRMTLIESFAIGIGLPKRGHVPLSGWPEQSIVSIISSIQANNVRQRSAKVPSGCHAKSAPAA